MSEGRHISVRQYLLAIALVGVGLGPLRFVVVRDIGGMFGVLAIYAAGASFGAAIGSIVGHPLAWLVACTALAPFVSVAAIFLWAHLLN